MLHAFDSLALVSLLSLAALGCAGVPRQGASARDVTGLYALESVPASERQVTLWVAEESDKLRVSLAGRVWRAVATVEHGVTHLVPEQSADPKLRLVADDALEVTGTDQGARRFKKVARAELDTALASLARDRTFVAARFSEDETGLELEDDDRIVCANLGCTLEHGGEPVLTSLHLTGWPGASAEPVTARELELAGHVQADPGRRPFTTFRALLDDRDGVEILVRFEGQGFQVYVPRDAKSHAQLHRRLVQWDEEMARADEALASDGVQLEELDALRGPAMQGADGVRAYLAKARTLPPDAWQEELPQHASHFVNLINAQVKAQRNDSAEDLFDFYLLRIHPRLPAALREASEQIAADMLVVYARTQDQSLLDKVVRDCLGGDAGAEHVKLPRLLFNLACVHALKSDKAGTLHFAERALARGKTPAEFRAESDFAGMKADPDFERLLRKYETPVQR